METQEISAHVTVETTPSVTQIVHQDLPQRGLYFRQNSGSNQSVTSDLLLGRWRLSLDLFGRVFMEDVGMEPGSIVSELGGFPVKEARFRRHMEKLRNGQQKDLTLSKMERTRTNLLIQTFKELNTQFSNQNRRVTPPLAFNRVKVTFKDEPGEGSGVARSFYTSIAEAILADEKLPNLEGAQVGSSKYSVSFTSMLRHRGSSGRESSSSARKSSGSAIGGGGGAGGSGSGGASGSGGGGGGGISNSHKSIWRPNRESRKTINYDSRYRPVSQQDMPGSSTGSVGGAAVASGSGASTSSNLSTSEPNAPSSSGYSNSSSNNVGASSSSSSSSSSKKMNPIVLLEEYQVEDNAPLFYSPGKRGIYSPRQGFATYERINAFRNVGR